MAKVPLTLQDPSRFAQIDAGGRPPLFFDPASVTALEPRDDGYTMHLAGGDTIELTAPIAAAVLDFLGLATAAVPKPKPKAKRRRKKTEVPAPSLKSPVGAAAAAFMSWLGS